MSVPRTKCVSLMSLLCQGLEVFAHAKRGWQCQPLLFARNFYSSPEKIAIKRRSSVYNQTKVIAKPKAILQASFSGAP